jgi:two-component system OmpR family sensor kinase
MARAPLRQVLAGSLVVSLGMILLVSNILNYFALERVLWRNGLVRLEDRIHTAFKDLEPRLHVEENPERVHHLWESPVRVASDYRMHVDELTHIMGNPSQFRSAILDPDGKVLSQFPDTDGGFPSIPNFADWTHLRDLTVAAMNSPEGHFRLRINYAGGQDGQILVAPLVNGRQFVGFIWLRGSWRPNQQALRNYAEFSLLTLILLVVVTIALSFWLAAVWTRPLERLAASANRVALGDLSARTALGRGGNEIYEVARTFDMMLDRIQGLFNSQRLFLADASHELKTPITALSGLVQMMELIEQKGSEPRRERSLGLMTRELDRMERLVADLLTLSRAEQQKPAFGSVSVKMLCEEALSAALVGAPGRKIACNLVALPQAAVEGDGDALVRALRNLLDNALHYTPPEGNIELTCGADEKELRFEVRDQGCGIEPHHLPHLGERFYRADPSRARKSGGTGLGLAIVKAIAEQHGGRLTIGSNGSRGTVATLILPRLKPRKDRLPPSDDPAFA